MTDLLYFKRDNDIKYDIFNLKDQSLLKNVDVLERPYLFVLSDNGLITNLFIPNKDNTDLSLMYYQFIKE